MNPTELERKARIIGHLMMECREHWRLFQEAIPMMILSAKFGRALNAVGGFKEIIQELTIDGTIIIVRKRTGGQTVLLNGMRQQSGGIRDVG